MPPPPPPKRPGAPSGAFGTQPPGPPDEPVPLVAPKPAPSARTTNTQQLIIAANSALRLRDEQLRARVQYYNSDLQTNAELDAITAQVVAELKQMAQGQASGRPTQEVEIELIQALRGLLEKLMSPKRSSFLLKKIEEVQRRITQLFFNSELYVRIQEGSQELPAASWPEQALYFALKRYEDFIESEIDSTPADEEIRERAKEKLQTFMRGLCTDFLSRTTPELERLLAIYKAVLLHFFQQVLPIELGDFAWEVIRESRVAVGHDLGYKLTADKFDAFREVFDRKFLERLVLNVQEPIVQKASETSGFREATLRFVADPQIHAEICTVINDALYDYLHGEGFLDLPPNWRRLLDEDE
jgi:hypothetical protein